MASMCTATVANNHRLPLAVPAADLDGTTRRTHNIPFRRRGARTTSRSADAAHRVTFGAAQSAQLKAGPTVRVQSGLDAGHPHDVQ